MSEVESSTPLSLPVSLQPLTEADALNLMRILNRATYTGMEECQVAVLLGIKLKHIAGDHNGKDVPAAN